ncbi:RING/U-box superfamily protein [Striga hermonthica]|uniref:RING/U-box superfamily protein n=1 Tax=Striga hermonthica TaxID=68872 RepID=A0A9N7NW90_STRHE|nr:RING/U-box superfamily protein [Striga hermonthica]
MERGESSGSHHSTGDVIWAKLVPLDSSYLDIELRSTEVVVCSEIKSSLSEKQEWCKITREKDQSSAIIQNKSFDPILVDGSVVHKDDTAIIRCGSEIILGPEADGYMRYMFKVMPKEEPCKKQLKILLDPEHAKCSICLNVWHDVVTVAPCLHNFCNGCFSEWLKRCQAKRSSVLCPQCRAVVQFVGKNHFLHSIEEDILQSDSSLRRSNEEIAVLDSCSSIKSPLVVCSGQKLKRKRARVLLDEENDRDFPCPQCGTEYSGFRCNESTVHLQCQSCGGMMPSRSNVAVPQHCLGCDRAFCGAYWHALGVAPSEAYPACSPDALKPIADRTITRIPFFAHEKNRHEQDITEKCIRQMGRSFQDVVSEWIRKFSNREVDRTRLPLNHPDMITSQTHVCSECYEKLVSFLLYWFRITLPKHLLPPEAVERQDCWTRLESGASGSPIPAAPSIRTSDPSDSCGHSAATTGGGGGGGRSGGVRGCWLGFPVVVRVRIRWLEDGASCPCLRLFVCLAISGLWTSAGGGCGREGVGSGLLVLPRVVLHEKFGSSVWVESA